jgi:hypothetical protein
VCSYGREESSAEVSLVWMDHRNEFMLMLIKFKKRNLKSEFGMDSL